MKKIFALVLAALMLFTFVACNSEGDNANGGSKQGKTTLADKTPKEIYDEAVVYIKGLSNYEILIDSVYNTTYNGESTTESSTTLHRCSGDTFYYLYKLQGYEEFFIHDGTTLYQNVNNVYEKQDVAYADFMKDWGSVTEQGMLIELPEKFFEKKLFIPEGEEYYLDFLITVEEYKDISGGSVTEPVKYRVYFDKNGVFTRFERSMSYYYYDVVLIKDDMTVTLSNVGSAAKTEAPQNADMYVTRVEAKDIDLSTVESLDLFEASSEITNYVLLDMKIDGSVKISDTETVEGYQGKILIRLFPEVAPTSVDNFQKLVAGSFYNGLVIHRVVPDFVIQGGDPKGDGTGGSENNIFGEFSGNGFTNNLSHKRGVVSMARSDDPDSASSQFFICHKDALTLDGKYAAFGYTVYGIDVVDIIAGLETDDNDKPKQNVMIEKASFVKLK